MTHQESIAAFEEVITKDGKFAPAYHELAKLYALDYSVNGRQRARQTIERAIQLDRNNPAYQMTLGNILWSQGFRANALDAYQKILKRHPDHIEALDGAGLCLVYDFLAMKDESVARDRNFSDFAEKAKQEAEQVLKRSIALNANNSPPYYILGMLYFENQQFPECLSLVNDLHAVSPADKDALLFCGLAHYQMGQFGQAHQFYERAFALMRAEERKLMESIDLLKSGEDRRMHPVRLSLDAAMESSDELERQKFWTSQNPLFLSGVNERRLEHFGRIAYANLRFRRFSESVEGWQTDMGKTWIKFGNFRHRRSSHINLGETWFYETFKIAFTGNGADIWVFGGGFSIPTGAAASGVDLMQVAREFSDSSATIFRRVNPLRNLDLSGLEEPSSHIFKKTEQRFVDPYLNRKYTLPYQIAAFLERDSVRVELSYMLPRERLSPQAESGEVHFWDGVFLFDTNWREVYQYRKSVSFPLAPPRSALSQAEVYRNNHLLIWRNLYVPKGNYHLAIEVLDQNSGAIGVTRNEVQFLQNKKGVHLSDVLVASRIEKKNPFPEHRDDLVITPNPLRTFSRSESVFLYLELYNLKRDQFGRTKYEISYTIGTPDVQTGSPVLFASQSILETLGETRIDQTGRMEHINAPELAIERSRGGDMVRTVTANYEGTQQNDFTYLQIDIQELPAGIYQLTVLAKDQQSVGVDVRRLYLNIVE